MRLLQKINDKITATAAETTDTYAYQPCFCMKNNGWTSFNSKAEILYCKGF